jgi:hypothetical protein
MRASAAAAVQVPPSRPTPGKPTDNGRMAAFCFRDQDPERARQAGGRARGGLGGVGVCHL